MEIRRILELRARIDKALASYLGAKKKSPDSGRDVGYINPSADVYVDGNRQLIFIETPDLIEDSVKIDLADGSVCFTASKRITRHTERKYLQIERKDRHIHEKDTSSVSESPCDLYENSYKLGVVKIDVEYGEKNEKHLSFLTLISALFLFSVLSGDENKPVASPVNTAVSYLKAESGVTYSIDFDKEYKINSQAPFNFFLLDKQKKEVSKIGWDLFKKENELKFTFYSDKQEHFAKYWFVACRYVKNEIVSCKTFSNTMEIK